LAFSASGICPAAMVSAMGLLMTTLAANIAQPSAKALEMMVFAGCVFFF
jgi:hypothetical protein